MSTNKKKEESHRDLTIENFKNEIKWEPKWRLKAEVIDCPPTVIAIFPKELFGAGLGCAIYNALERERGSNVVWRIR